jgi:hypothetical protein
LAEAGATPEIVGRLFAEAQRNRRNDRMIHAYAFMLEGALGTLRVQASGEDVGADHTIAAVVHKEVADNLRKSSIAPDVLMLVARAFACAELDPGRPPKAATIKSTRREPNAPSLGERVLALAAGKTRQELYAACPSDRPNHVGMAVQRHIRAGRIQERDGKLYATSPATEQAPATA